MNDQSIQTRLLMQDNWLNASERDRTTGFVTRHAAQTTTEHLISGMNGENACLAALWINLDRFRQINQSFGHTGGDRMIVRMAECLRTGAPPGSECLRMGSDEFVVLAPTTSPLDAEGIAHNLLNLIDQPIPMDGITIRPSASIGLALYRPGESAPSLLERADRAMLEAKRQGGNRLALAAEEAQPGGSGIQLAREELAIESALHAALESGGLELAYQPIIGIDGSVKAVEALMRCNALGMRISPEKFIPVAEKTGLIIRLGEWSLLKGAQCAATLKRQGFSTRVAINVSRAQLIFPSFLAAVHGAMICNATDASMIELELTESLLMDPSPAVQANLRGAHEAGINLVIDDFGTGYSCLANLKDLPVSKLKFDRAFIRTLPGDRHAYAIVKAMTLLAHELGMSVVAEGVETAEQLEACAMAGVDSTQGFFNAAPMSEADLNHWMITRENK